MIKNIIFDVGNVLVTFDWDDLARKVGFTEDEIELMRIEVIGSRWDELDRGVMEERKALAYIKEAIPGMEDKFDELWRRIEECIAPYPYTEGWIKGLKNQGFHVYLLSNYPKEMFIRGTVDKLKFANLADGKIISSFVKLVKPDPAIYKCLFETYGLNPEECIFIDDREKNVKAAEELGVRGIIFTGYENANKEIMKIVEREKKN